MAQRGHFKQVEKYQFNEQKFTTVDGVDQFEAIHIESKQEFTLKRVGLNSASQRQFSARVLQEVSILKKLAHPLLPKCHKLLKTSHNMYLIFDHITGTTLRSFTGTISHQNCKSKLNSILKMAEQLCEVMVSLADKQICHSNINPLHILVQGQNLAKIIGFRYAVDMNSKENLDISPYGRQIDDYCAPEVQDGRVDAKTDVFSCGAVLEEVFLVTREKSGSSNPEDEASLDNILSFISKRMKSPDPLLRATAKQALIYFKQRGFQANKHEEERHQLLLTDPGVRISSFNQTKMVKQRSQSPLTPPKVKKANTEIQNQEYIILVRTVIYRRNLSQLLLQLAEFCSYTLLSHSQCSLPLAFLLLKKSTSMVSQLAKFLQTGRGDGLRMQEKTKEKLKKNKSFSHLQRIIYTQMKQLQQQLASTAQLVKEVIKPEGKLAKELEVETLDNEYLKRCVQELQKQLGNWVSQQIEKGQTIISFSNVFTKKQLIMFYIFTLLPDFNNFQHLFEELFSKNGYPLWQEPFLTTMMTLQPHRIEDLIIQQGKGNRLQLIQEISTVSLHSISSSHRI